jgi:hypothetical protein
MLESKGDEIKNITQLGLYYRVDMDCGFPLWLT